ncbi:glutaredoxin domain-containing protein [Qaidamihabitans albus]|uniref:glutaredoxin domain-containing protein n=1 Tax=Qaidamihabitans albus TaxID=2795733 RepID=UPI0018F18718|nr:glutaredoxin domain-containing protein [Qaidamihabitans albus]
MSDEATPSVTVYWRPGCPYCSRLLGDLDRIGLPIRKVDIWQDTGAAARVRSVAGGNETVPTVVVGDDHAMVNPSATEVVEAARAQAPGLLDKISQDGLAKIAVGPWHAGLGFAIVIAGLWFALAAGNPTTTYHFASAIVAAAWPVGRRLRAARALPAVPAMATAFGGGLLAVVTTALLAARNALAGPALFGLPNGLTETLAGIALGTLAGAALAVVPRRRDPRSRARRRGDPS